MLKNKLPILLLILFLVSSSTLCRNNDGRVNSKIDIAYFQRIKSMAKKSLLYCKSNKYNEDYCILIDMKRHSGLKRFFVWNFRQDTIVMASLVSHGCGDNFWASDHSKDSPKFSNQDGSHLSSLGKYKIGARGYSNWGINVNYLMHGLETTNSNALKRQIVFHSWDVVADSEVYPDGTPEGWGCPAISNNNMSEVDKLLKTSKKPVLMWIFN